MIFLLSIIFWYVELQSLCETSLFNSISVQCVCVRIRTRQYSSGWVKLFKKKPNQTKNWSKFQSKCDSNLKLFDDFTLLERITTVPFILTQTKVYSAFDKGKRWSGVRALPWDSEDQDQDLTVVLEIWSLAAFLVRLPLSNSAYSGITLRPKMHGPNSFLA